MSPLNKWIDKYNGPYCISNKLDGVSALFINEDNNYKLYTRGDGIYGLDISHLINYITNINNIKIKNGVAVRGELIINKTNFNKYKDKMATSRNMISGIVNSKSINKLIINNVEFIAYELINPWINDQYKQFLYLKKYNFSIVQFLYNIKKIDVDILSSILLQQKNDYNYDIDGIIITNNELSDRYTSGNPSYSFAYKESYNNDLYKTKVIKINWSITKDGFIKPILLIDPININGVTITNVFAYNAKFLIDNKLGIDSEIVVIRSGDVIPKVLKVIKGSDNIIFPDIKYKWTDSGIDIITIVYTNEQKIREITNFFKKLKIKNIDKGIVSKLIQSKIDTIQKIFTINFETLLKLDGFDKKLSTKLYNNIKSKLDNITLLDLMVSSNMFGHGIGDKTLKKILNKYPDILNIDDIDITDISGIDEITNNKFIKGMKKFKKFYNDISNYININNINKIYNDNEIYNKKDIFKDMIIVFSGFRNKKWEDFIENNGGKINNNVSSKTNLLIVDNIDSISSKIETAKKLKINIIDKNQ